jgi:DNA-binding LacI/PurR family transcriptional regulator
MTEPSDISHRKPGESSVPSAHDPVRTAMSAARNACVVAVAAPDRSFFDRCMDLLFWSADKLGLAVTYHLVKSAEAEDLSAVLGNVNAIGCVVFRHALEPLARRLSDAGKRTVIVGAPSLGAVQQVPHVFGDHVQGAYLAMRHLIDLGHRHILADPDSFDTSIRRLGHERAIQEAARAGLSVQITPLTHDQLHEWYAHPQMARYFFGCPGAPTAVLAWNDQTAVKTLSALVHLGLRVPEDVSIVGYDNMHESELVHPTLTTVDHAIDRQLSEALQLLLQPAPPAATVAVTVPPILIPRGSSAPARRPAAS